MEIIPLITIKNRKILNSEEKLKQLNEEQRLYINDIDGIEKDKPNLCTFQRLSKTQEIWVDSGPRDLGDIVDVFFAGASAIIIRMHLFPKIDISKIREISENKIFAFIDFDQKTADCVYNDFDGLINFTKREKFEHDFKYGGILKQHTTKKIVVFVYDSDIANINYWKYLGSTNFLVDLDNFEEFKKNAF
jgi:uncharacterized protein related to proFAR isomerase